MQIVFRWLLRLAAAMVVVAVVGVATVYYLASRSLPDYNKTLQVSGLTGEVEILRDHANVPHIFGASDADVFFGLGYAHAQDRLWQMITMRRTAQGRLSEVFGLRTLAIDKLVRRLDLYALARRSVDAQDPETLTALQAYADGVNARLDEVNEGALGRGAPEMFLFNAPISPWQPADSLAMVKLMSLQLSGQLAREVRRARTSLALPDPDRIIDILPDAPGKGIAALPAYAALFPALAERQFAAAAPAPHIPLSPVMPIELAGASNAFAAGSTRSATGGTLLANDPHLGLSAPAIWYLARLELANGGVIGGTIPGMPVVLVGRSAKLGWGLTSSYLDDQDVVIEQVNPEDPEQYRTPDGWKKFVTRDSIVTVKDQTSVTLRLLWTDNGPVLSGADYRLADITPPGHVAALAWTALSAADTSLAAGLKLMQAPDRKAAIAAMADYIAPAQNLVLVDAEGIAMKSIGAMPRRNVDHETMGRMPARGWLAQNRWRGMLPYLSNPEFVDPSGGLLANTNNKLLDRPFPQHVSYDWGDSQRIHRLQRLLGTRQVHTRDSFIEAQLDTVSYTARSLLPLIGKDLWFTGEAAPEGTPERLRQHALNLLADWNGEMNEHLPEPLIYAAWLRALQARLIQDDLGPLAAEYTQVEPLFIERVYRDIDGASIWCDVRQSTPIETCTDIARLALDDALVWITSTWGTALDSLRWGDAHQAAQDHQTLGKVPLLRYFVNIRQSTSGGDNTLMRGATRGGFGADAFLNVHAAGYRGVYDFADPDSSVFVISTGQSGHFLSRHYDDLAQLWRRGEYIPMSLDQDLARAAAVGVTRLIPRN
ncbi:penicillin acylase family protein [Pseudooceanicola sp.]|uniref:penicillin acylase family protein n=1 Tax=Pseudooceanicola sp. TaxID=1914328 RepID=UPI00262DFD5D|nr:penicillin acylase family protein [Pseudooceanicola sp.]MDF1855821.1 penicillin acylase family protein [Pseudooceanicola sp.]